MFFVDFQLTMWVQTLITLFLQHVSPFVAVIGSRFPGAAVVAEAPIRRSHQWRPPMSTGPRRGGPCFEIGKTSASKAVA
jgi:hypothetical protein